MRRRRSGPLLAAAAAMICLALRGPPETEAWPISACAPRRGAAGRRRVARSAAAAKPLSKLPWEDGYGAPEEDDGPPRLPDDGDDADGGGGEGPSPYEEAADALLRRGLPADAGRPLSPSERIRGAVLGGDLSGALRAVEREMGEGGGWRSEEKGGGDGDGELDHRAEE